MSTIKKEGRKAAYEASFRIAIAREYLTSSLGYGRLATKYNLPGSSTVVSFVQWYKSHYPDKLSQLPPDDQADAMPDPDKQRNKPLQEANFKITGLEMLIENASKELGVDLVKKFGAKQSKK